MTAIALEKKTIFVTGAAGFIGANLVKRIYQQAPSATVIGIDNMKVYARDIVKWGKEREDGSG